MKLIKHIFLILLLAAISWDANALHLKTISTTEGLSNRRVFMSAVDESGYMWFATRSGIDRYNGEKLSNYTLCDPRSKRQLNPKGILISDKEIIAYSDTSIFYYEETLDQFVQKQVTPKTNINTIVPDPSGNLWIGTAHGLIIMKKNGTFEEIEKLNEPVYSIFLENPSTIWLGTSSGLYLLTQTSTTTNFKVPSELTELQGKRVQTLYFDSVTQDLWIGTFSHGVYRYSLHKKNLVLLGQHSHKMPVRCITAIGKDRIWVGYDGGGIGEYDRFNADLIVTYSTQMNGRQFLTTNNIYHILEHQNSIWICTYTQGILVHKKNQFLTKEYQHIKFNANSLINNHINAILEDRQHRIWFGTNRGISRLNPSTGKWKHFTQNHSQNNEVIVSLLEDKNGDIWAGGYSCDIVRIDAQDRIHKVELTHEIKNRDLIKYIYAMYQDKEGYIWMGGLFHPIVRYDPKNNTIASYPIRGSITQILPWDKYLLFACSRGIAVLDTTTGKYEYLNDNVPRNILNTHIQWICIRPDKKSEWWIASENDGIICYDVNTHDIKTINRQNGLSSNNICSMLFDTQNKLWVGTETGLNCIDPESLKIESFYTQDGLLSNTLNLRTMIQLENEHIIVGTPIGAFEFAPHQHTTNNIADPNLRFEEFVLFSQPQLPGQEKNSPLKSPIDQTEKIILKYNQHSFSFRFLDITYFNQENDRYSWFLEGFEKDWCQPVEEHYTNYTNIPPGKYTFHVRVHNIKNPNVFQERSIKIQVKKPWWNSVLALFIYIILTIAVIYEISKLYKDRLEARDSNQKIRFFINLAHDIRTPLTLIKAPLNEISEEELTENGKTALGLAQRNTEKLMNMVSQLLDFQKIEREVMTLQTEETEINSFISSTISNFEPLARERQITLHTILCPKTQNCYIDRKKVSIVLDNLVSNSLKYTCQNGNVWVKVNVNDGTLILEVIDDGIGITTKDQKKLFNRFYRGENAINSSETGSGIGLLLTKKMTLLHKGSIDFNSKEGCGTSFIIKLPIRKTDYSKTEIIRKEYRHLQTSAQSEEEDNNKNKMKLLIVEDNEELRSYLCHYFSKSYMILESCDGAQGFDVVKTQNPDFIISDVMMPNISGIDLCRKLKSNIETCHIPIILLTSLAEREDIINGLNAGADDYITKPFDLPVLKSKIKTILQNRVLYKKKYIDRSAFSETSDNINDLDRKFMKKVVDYIEEKLSCEDFSIDNLANEMAMSRSVFFKKIKSLTGQSPQDFIRDFKMKKAITLLTEKKYSIGEIAYLTGYPNAKYFSTAFKKYYGKSPSNYLNEE